MSRKITASIIGAAAALSAGGAVASGATASVTGVSAAATRHVEGRIVNINRPAHTFTVRDAERGKLTVKVTSATRFDRIAGFPSLHVSQRVDVRAIRSAGAWRATKVEPGDVAVSHSADDRAGHDLGDDHGAHNEPGDDRSR